MKVQHKTELVDHTVIVEPDVSIATLEADYTTLSVTVVSDGREANGRYLIRITPDGVFVNSTRRPLAVFPVTGNEVRIVSR